MDSIFDTYATLATGNVCDADKALVKVMDIGIKPLAVSMKVAGPAYTVQCQGGNNLAIHQAITLAPPGSVLVIDVGGCTASGHIGDLMSTACQVRGIQGIVIDGTCRDMEDIIKMGFPVFARGGNPHSNAKVQAGAFNVTVRCGGLDIAPGDIIFGDATGVVTFPASELDNITSKAKAIMVKELGIVQEIYAGKTTMDIYSLKPI